MCRVQVGSGTPLCSVDLGRDATARGMQFVDPVQGYGQSDRDHDDHEREFDPRHSAGSRQRRRCQSHRPPWVTA